MERIAEAVGVSNTPVREGLLSLRSEGFVRLVPRRGFVVADFSQRDIQDLFWAQAKLAGELAARAAKNMTPDRLDRLQANLEEYDVAIAAGDKTAIADLGHVFHREVNLAADSQRLALLLGSVVKHLPNRFYATIEGQVEGARTEHPMLLAAFRKRDARKARALMEQHIQEGADRLIETLEKQGLWGETEDEPAP
jgi:DNA-binding GntR family transcriptional regulator